MFFKISINVSDKKFRELKLEDLFENLIFKKIKKKLECRNSYKRIN